MTAIERTTADQLNALATKLETNAAALRKAAAVLLDESDVAPAATNGKPRQIRHRNNKLTMVDQKAPLKSAAPASNGSTPYESIQDRAFKALQGLGPGNHTTKEVADVLKVDNTQAYGALYALVAKEKVLKLPLGDWRIK